MILVFKDKEIWMKFCLGILLGSYHSDIKLPSLILGFLIN